MIQPKPVILAKRKPNGMPSVRYRHPHRILPGVKSKESLLSMLDYYAHPFMKMRVPDNTLARRKYVEETRPALRYYCKRYRVKIPEWLEGNGHYDGLPEEEHNEMFGEGPLEVHEFFREESEEAPEGGE